MTNIPEEVVARMCALVREAVSMTQDGKDIRKGVSRERSAALFDEAMAIAALLPEPVDPDLLRAREIAGDVMKDWSNGWQTYASGAINAVRTGNDDKHLSVQCALAGIKAARAS